ncbi:MAG TPA: hypothetical protein VGP93_12525, partial [Polyangiaceae bacterium]|nr:hypothetical protein [Polyangiaceae bacterium]
MRYVRFACAISGFLLFGCGSNGPAAPDPVNGAGAQAGKSSGQQGGSGGMLATGGSAGEAGTYSGGMAQGGSSGTSGGATSGGATSAGMAGATSCPGGVTPPSGTAPALVPGEWTNISPPGLYRPRGSVPPYGVMDVHSVRCSPYTLYVLTDVEGLWKSMDGGSTWSLIGNLPSPNSPGVMALDPSDPAHLYLVGGVRGASLGFWVSSDGGETWAQPKSFTDGANNSEEGWTNDVYQVAADPADFKHVLLTFHSGFAFKADAGLLESTDGGESWKRHAPQANWGAGSGISFLNDRNTWLLATQGGGYFRTSDAGATWAHVSSENSMHGACIGFFSEAGILYVGANNQILRSSDMGVSFDTTGPYGSDGYYQVIGDGNFLYAQISNTGANSMGPQPYITSPDGDGQNWTSYNEQT